MLVPLPQIMDPNPGSGNRWIWLVSDIHISRKVIRVQSIAPHLRSRLLPRGEEITGARKLLGKISQMDDKIGLERGDQLVGAISPGRPIAGITRILRVRAGSVNIGISNVVGIRDDDELELDGR